MHRDAGTRPLLFAAIGPAALLFASCGASVSAEDILDQAPRGAIEGEAFDAVEAAGRYDVPGSGDRLFVTLFEEDVDECSGVLPSGTRQILLAVPPNMGEYPLRLDFGDPTRSQVVTFVTRDNVNLVAVDGIIAVDAIDDVSASIGILAMVTDSEVNGRIDVRICP
ncbi:MAG: hypothetical protein ACFCGT_15540 [Sandaracinaceae bacterium]